MYFIRVLIRTYLEISRMRCDIMNTIHYFITEKGITKTISSKEKDVKANDIEHILLKMYQKDIDKKVSKS